MARYIHYVSKLYKIMAEVIIYFYFIIASQLSFKKNYPMLTGFIFVLITSLISNSEACTPLPISLAYLSNLKLYLLSSRYQVIFSLSLLPGKNRKVCLEEKSSHRLCPLRGGSHMGSVP